MPIKTQSFVLFLSISRLKTEEGNILLFELTYEFANIMNIVIEYASEAYKYKFY